MRKHKPIARLLEAASYLPAHKRAVARRRLIRDVGFPADFVDDLIARGRRQLRELEAKDRRDGAA
jgi:hypothetical protein